RGSYIDDGTATLSIHQSGGGLYAPDHTLEAHVDHAIDCFRCDIGHGLVANPGCVVDQDVEPALVVIGSLHGALDAFTGRNIGYNRECLATFFGDLCDHGINEFLLQVVDADDGATCRHLPRRFLADAVSGTRDQRNATFKIFRHVQQSSEF